MAVMLGILTACLDEHGRTPDLMDQCPLDPVERRCGGARCGDGVQELCWIPGVGAGHCSRWVMESCDGGETCADFGYYNTDPVCTPNCTLSTSTCTACSPEATLCKANGVATGALSLTSNGTRFALVTGDHVSWFDADLRLGTTKSYGAGARVGAVTGGWLVVGTVPTRLEFVTDDGVSETSVALPSGMGFALSAPANGHVLVAWSDASGVSATIVSERGAIEIPAMQVLPVAGTPSVTTDGTNFWVAAGGALAKVGPSGDVTTTSFVPAGGHSQITWNGTEGVYAQASGLVTTLARFNAAGAKLGEVSIAATVFDMIPDGPNVLALVGGTVTLTSIDPTSGTVTPGKDIGAGGTNRRIAWFGSDVVVAWTREASQEEVLQLAIAAP